MNRTLAVLFLTLLGTVPMQAKTPNLTGTWKANIEKSSFGRSTPKSLVYKVKDTPEGLFLSEMQVDAEGNQSTSELKFDRGGKETVNQMGDTEARTTLTDKDDRIHEVTTFNGPGGAFTRKSTIMLSPDGKTLTMDSVFSSAGGETPVKIVLEKQ
jgi:hypothetical protein